MSIVSNKPCPNFVSNSAQSSSTMSTSTMRLSTRVINFKKDVPGSQMFDVKWNNLSSGVIINHDLPACFEIFSGTSLDQELCLVRVSYDPTKAPAKFDGYRMKMTFSDETNRIPTLTVKVKMVDNSDSEEHDQSVTHVFSESSAREECVECQVCLAPFSDHIEDNIPRILSACGHTICHNCAVNIQTMTSNRLVIACPFDRIVTKSKAENLPRNFTIIELICERAEKEKRNEKIKAVKICENPINPCYENRKHESTRYCRTCEVDFCESCFLLVHSPKILSNHEFEPVPRHKFKIPQCPMHEDNIITYLCKDMKCNSVPFCCNTCKENFHENHVTVPIITIAEGYERDLRDLLKTLSSTKGELNKALGETKRNLESMNKGVFGYQEMMKAIKKHFEQKTEEAYKRLDGLLDVKTDGLMKDEKKIVRDLKQIEEIKKEIEKTLKRKDTLFTQELLQKGKALCKINLPPFSLPTLEEIVNPTCCSPSEPLQIQPTPAFRLGAPLIRRLGT